ncbi:MAG TPA: DNA-processing protein DprA [Chitinophagaceae bacterium]|jgi:DNA processing protein|nr:DNA-processing protein DprA [Chitinophagaceae bacterium]
MNQELLYQLALTEIPNIGCVQAKILIEHFGEADAIFKAKESSLKNIEGIGEIRAHSIKSFTDFSNAEKEIKFIEKFKIRPLFITDADYPKRLLNCYDSPTLLFYKGKADLNSSKVVAVIGTRSHTEYARQLTDKLINDLAEQHVFVVSGLAFGVDALAHKAAIKNNLPTIGVLAHGLDQIYPAEHAGLARDMIRHGGGLLTEFRSNRKPDKHNFPIRNRIVAGMSDAIIVVETDIRGGSMITAELANGYNKDLFAFPGKTTDNKSTGCNYLIRNNKATLITKAEDLIQSMGWEEKKKTSVKKQKELFIELTDDEKKVVKILQEKEAVHIDEINFRSGTSSSAVAAAILNLELKNVIKSSPGKMYSLQ